MPNDAAATPGSGSGRAAGSTSPPPVGPAGSLRAGRSTLLGAGLVAVAVWLTIVFAGVLSALDDATDQADALRADSAALERRLEAGRRELELVQTDAFQRLQARAYGYGAEGERPFSLEQAAPSPPPVIPLAAESAPVERTPLEAWLELLFGR